MSKDCSIEFNSQLYPGFIDLHGLPSDSGVSTLKMTLGHMQQVQHQALAVKGKIEKYWQNCLTLVAISIGVAWQRCLKSCPVYHQFKKCNTVDICCVYINVPLLLCNPGQYWAKLGCLCLLVFTPSIGHKQQILIKECRRNWHNLKVTNTPDI